MQYNLRKQFFSSRIIDVRNSLANDVVSSESTNIFKNRLGKFWTNQDFKFNRNTDNTGNHSVQVFCFVNMIHFIPRFIFFTFTNNVANTYDICQNDPKCMIIKQTFFCVAR